MDTHFSEPRPKNNVSKFRSLANWQATSVLNDVRLTLKSDQSFDEVFENRRTNRIIAHTTLRETRAFIKHVFATRQLGQGVMRDRKRKTTISAGALHPIDIIIVDGPDVTEPILYCDRKGKFLTLPVLNPVGFASAVAETLEVQTLASGHLILFAGNLRRLSHFYSEPKSLLWRDSGAAAQACSVAAHAYGFRYCPLGINGHDILAAIGPPHDQFLAVGTSIFGQ